MFSPIYPLYNSTPSETGIKRSRLLPKTVKTILLQALCGIIADRGVINPFCNRKIGEFSTFTQGLLC